MKNYSEMSDFEINKAVGEISLDGRWACKPGHAGNDSESWYYGSVDTFVTAYPSLPDYCNSWADAGPIISNNKIDINFGKINGREYKSKASGPENHCGYRLSCMHENPLRAAMTVFLAMQESK